MARLDDQLAALATMSQALLRERWTEMFGDDPANMPATLLRRAIAYRLQEQAHGGLPAAAGRMLDALGRDTTAEPYEPPIRVKPGTRLVREWNGQVHTVLVVEDGLLFEDQRYASLSHVAREITGARWSGPRFFGLKRRPLPPRQVARG